MAFPLYGLLQSTEIKEELDVFYIRLPQYNNVMWKFPRRKFIEMYPNSLNSNALEQDPSAMIIDLEQRIITPEVVSFLWFTLQYNRIPSLPPTGLGLYNAGRYLGIDLMLFVEGKAYQQSMIETKYNLLNPTDLIRAYSPIMHYCIEYNDVYFARYV